MNTTSIGDNVAFKSAYSLFVTASAQRCTFWLTDVGITKPNDVTNALIKNGYDLRRDLEVLSTPETPPQCITRTEEAVREAGFVSIRSRAVSEKDRLQGRP